MNIDQELAAFEAWVAQFDTYSDEYQDMGADQYFIAGYQAALASPEVQALRKDAERLDFITAPESAWFVQWEKRSGKPVRFRMIDDGEVFGKWHDTARQAIDSAKENQP